MRKSTTQRNRQPVRMACAAAPLIAARVQGVTAVRNGILVKGQAS